MGDASDGSRMLPPPEDRVDPEIRLRLSYDVWAGKQMSRRIIRRDQRRCVCSEKC